MNIPTITSAIEFCARYMREIPNKNAASKTGNCQCLFFMTNIKTVAIANARAVCPEGKECKFTSSDSSVKNKYWPFSKKILDAPRLNRFLIS